MCCHEAQMIEVGSSARWTRCLQRLSLSTVVTKTKGREATPTLGASARRFLCGRRRDRGAAPFVALVLLAAQQPSIAATRNPAQLPWRSAQATSSPQPAAAPPHQQPAAAPPLPQPTAAAPAPPPPAAAPSPQNDDTTKEEKTTVPATVV